MSDKPQQKSHKPKSESPAHWRFPLAVKLATVLGVKPEDLETVKSAIANNSHIDLLEPHSVGFVPKMYIAEFTVKDVGKFEIYWFDGQDGIGYSISINPKLSDQKLAPLRNAFTVLNQIARKGKKVASQETINKVLGLEFVKRIFLLLLKCSGNIESVVETNQDLKDLIEHCKLAK